MGNARDTPGGLDISYPAGKSAAVVIVEFIAAAATGYATRNTREGEHIAGARFEGDRRRRFTATERVCLAGSGPEYVGLGTDFEVGANNAPLQTRLVTEVLWRPGFSNTRLVPAAFAMAFEGKTDQ